ncbi:MAG: hypothetical protein EWM47_13180, partial [Anaerolineaceae bacterium]
MLKKLLSLMLTVVMLLTSISGVKAAELTSTSAQITSTIDAKALLVKYSSSADDTAFLFIDDILKSEIPITSTGGATVVKEFKVVIPKGSLVRLVFTDALLVEDMIVSEKYEAEYANLYGVDGDGNEIEVVGDGGASNGLKVVKIWGNGSYLEFPNVSAGTHLTLGYSCAAPERRMSLYINGVDTGININIDNLSSGWGGVGEFRELTIPYDIPEGATIKLQKDDDNADLQMDYIKVTTLTEADLEAPTAPSDVVSTSTTNRAARLTWTASEDNIEVAGYNIYVNDIKNNSILVVGTSYLVRGLIPDTEYTFKIVAVDAAGNISDPGSLTLTTDLPETGTDVKYEAEYANLFGLENIHVESDGGASNGEKVVCVWGTGAYLEFPKVISGTKLAVGYASGDADRKISVYINGEDSGLDVVFDATGGYGGFGNYTEALIDISIPEDATIKLFRDGDDNSDVHVDYIRVFSEGPVSDIEAPTAPTDVRAITSHRTASLSWTASDDNVEVIGYDVFVNDVKINNTLIVDTHYLVRGLSPETGYTFKVVAKDAAGNISDAGIDFATTDLAESGSNVIYEAEHAKLYGLENIHVEADEGASNGEKVVCIWGTGAYLELSKVVSGSAISVRYASGDSGRKISVYIDGVDSGKDIIFDATGGYGGLGNYQEATVNIDVPSRSTIRLFRDADDNSDVHIDYIRISSDRVVEPVDTIKPTTPGAITLVSKSDTRIRFSWKASTDNSGQVFYDVYRNGEIVATVNIPFYDDAGLTAETQYAYQVVARDAAGNSTEGTVIFISTESKPQEPIDVTAPTVPNRLRYTIDNTTINLIWE